MTKSSLRHPRGYLLIETMVSGAIIALILGAAMSIVASERVATTHATLRARASALAEERLNQLVADFNVVKMVNDGTTYPACQVCTSPCTTPPAESWIVDNDFNNAEYVSFTREFFCREIGDAVGNGSGEIFEVGVRVTYPSDANNATAGTDQIVHRAVRRDRYAK